VAPCARRDQHLADPVAYRRDRRKDRLLQKNGYLVLRFLAQDVGKDLEQVLDTILRALARQRGRSWTPSKDAIGPSDDGGRETPGDCSATSNCRGAWAPSSTPPQHIS
jgi:hypothetical protein